MRGREICSIFAAKLYINLMILFNDSLFVTDEKEGFRICRKTRSSCTATMTVLLCTAGYIDVYFHGSCLRIRPNEMFVRIPDFSQPLGQYEMSADFEFMQVTFAASVYEKIMLDHLRVEPDWWTKQEYIKAHPIFKMDERSMDYFRTYFHLLYLQLSGEQTDYKHQIMVLIGRSSLLELLNYMDRLALIDSGQRATINQSDYIFRKFIHMLQEHPHEREVQWYAGELNITPKYLSEVCRQRSRKSAGEWIADVTVSELKHYLKDTTLPIHEVAKVMEFPNASFFCQYTKKHLGMTPNHFRKKFKVDLPSE